MVLAHLEHTSVVLPTYCSEQARSSHRYTNHLSLDFWEAGRCTLWPWIANFLLKYCEYTIGAKRGGTREQCSQKLFELAEIFWKIIKIFINIKYIRFKMKKIGR